MKPQRQTETSLGPCCVCRTTIGVRNILSLDRKSPIPGHGWACFTFNLPMDGAVAVTCDRCLKKDLVEACKGYPGLDGRVPYTELRGHHLHDLRRHRELHDDPAQLHSSLHWFTDSPDAGHPDCLCSYCGQQIRADDEDEDDDEIYEPGPVRAWKDNGRLEARFHYSCFTELLEMGVMTA